MWYVIQTITGKEEELARAAGAYLSPELCEDCFTVKRKLIKRLGGEWVAVTETLFPSYLFLVYKAAGRQRRKLYSAGSRGKRLFNENLPQRGQRYGRRPDRPVFRSERGDPESRRTSPIFFRQNCKIEPEKAVCSDRAYHSGAETDRCVWSQVEERGASGKVKSWRIGRN